jgi:cyclopropane-fatty-acyl-phospholipid synthase
MVESTVKPPQARKEMEPHFEEVQAHYDLSDDFFGLFQDPSRTYSCAYFERDDMSLEEAQMAKIDLALGKLNLQPGMTLLDIGCGWGSVMQRAVEKYDVNVIGLTLSKNQAKFAQELLDGVDTERSRRVLLMGWEQFDEPVDRIISLEAIEAFPQERYAPFFHFCSSILPTDGRMLIQAILGHPLKRWPEMGIPPRRSSPAGRCRATRTSSRCRPTRASRWRRSSCSTSTTSRRSTSGPRRSRHTTTKRSPRRRRRSTSGT